MWQAQHGIAGGDGEALPWPAMAGRAVCAHWRARDCCCCQPQAMRRPRSGRPRRRRGRQPKSRSRKVARKTAPPLRRPQPGARMVRRGERSRDVAAMSAEIGGDEARTRFSLVLSGTAPYQYFLLGRPLSGHHRHTRRELSPAQGSRPAAPGPDRGLSLWPVCARQVAHRHRYQGAGTRGGGCDGAPAGLDGGAAQPRSHPDRPGELPGQAGAARIAAEGDAAGASRKTSPAPRRPSPTPSP